MICPANRCGYRFALACLVMSSEVWSQAAATAAPGNPAPNTEPSAFTYRIEGGAVVAVKEGVVHALPIAGTILGLELVGARLYVAKGSLGYAVYDVTEPLAPRVIQEQSTHGALATGFTVIQGQLWVLLTSKSAQPIDAADTAPLSTTATADAAPKPVPVRPAEPTRIHTTESSSEPSSVEIRVIGPGVIEIAEGVDQGVRVGDRFTLVRFEALRGVQQTQFVGEKIVGSAEVVAMRPESCLAEVSRSAMVRSNDRARKAKPQGEEESNAFPQRTSNVGEYGMVLRPLLKIGRPLGAGVLADLDASYWGNGYFAGVAIQPLGLGTTSDGQVVAVAALAEGGYDGAAFAAGLGLGMGWVNGDIDEMLGAFAADEAKAATPVTTTKQSTNSAFAVSQVVRLGARDGLRLQLRNTLLLHRKSAEQERGFIYGGTSGKLVKPIGRRADLFVEAGGGVMGYWFFGLGVGSWIIGNGSPGSLYLSVSAGGAGISGSREVTRSYSNGAAGTSSYAYDEDLDVAGPMASIGLARRFEF